MISLAVVFYIFIFFFALIGGLRGCAKELIVVFSVVLSLFVIWVLESYIGVVATPYIELDKKYGYVAQEEQADIIVIEPENLVKFNGLPNDQARSEYRTQFWLRTTILIIVVFFGYQTPIVLARLGRSAGREKIQDFLLGLVLGGVNGYLIMGTLWSYMHSSHYLFEPFIIAPTGEDPLVEAAKSVISLLPPAWLSTTPIIFIAICLAFLFVLVVFI